MLKNITFILLIAPFFCFGQLHLGLSYENSNERFASNIDFGEKDSTLYMSFGKSNTIYFDVQFPNGIAIEMGYFRREYFTGNYLSFYNATSNDWFHIENGRTIPIRVLYAPTFKNETLNFLFVQGGVGVQFHKYSKDSENPNYTAASNLIIGDQTEVFTKSQWMEENDINQVHSSMGLEGKVRLGVRLSKYFQFFATAGYVKNFKEIGKVRYSYSSSLHGIFESGETTTKGSNKYFGLGCRLSVPVAIFKQNKEVIK